MGVKTPVLGFSRALVVALLLVGSNANPFGIGVNAQRREFAANCNLHGRVAAKFPDGSIVSATNAKVFVFYSSEYVDNGFRDKYFTHHPTLYTAGGQFNHRYIELIEHDKVLKVKDKTPPSDDRALEIATKMLKYEDEAIAGTLDWIAKHLKEAWLVVMVTPDEQGSWAVKGLLPGSYDIVIRGTVSRLDADWVSSCDLEPEKTCSFEDQPRYFRPSEK